MTGDPSTGWQTIGSVSYVSDDDTVVGGAFTSYYRHQWNLSYLGSPVPATALRLVNSLESTDFDEIEIQGSSLVPEPSTLMLLVLVSLGLAVYRQRGRQTCSAR